MKNKKLIDVHCHYFSKTILTEDAVNLLNSINIENLPFLNNASHADEQAKINKAFNFCLNSNAKEYYQYMKDIYGEDFIAVPLMMDMSYVMEKVNTEIQEVENKKNFRSWLSERLLSQNAQTFLNIKNINVFKGNYQIQIDELVELKKENPDNIFPFFSIDPRKDFMFEDGVLGEIKKYVGKGKPFTGLKLYTGLGYSPTDPVLYKGKNSVYAWCEQNKIPITVHSSDVGFSHFQNEIDYRGDIYYAKAGQPVSMHDYNKDMTVTYENTITKAEQMVHEKQVLHNHPSLWKKVLKKYPKLKINFAHFGGTEHLRYYSKGNTLGYWTKQIVELLDKYPNVYADLSCFSNGGYEDFDLGDVYNNIYLKLSKSARKRIMYGSDFYLIFLFKYSLTAYFEEFKNAFGKDFEKIAYDNPAEFLGFNDKKWYNRLLDRFILNPF